MELWQFFVSNLTSRQRTRSMSGGTISATPPGLRGGIATLGYSWADLAGHPCEGTAGVAAVLRLGGWTGTL
jgi:hypothetical protein